MSEKSDARAVPVNVMMRRPTLYGFPQCRFWLRRGYCTDCSTLTKIRVF